MNSNPVRRGQLEKIGWRGFSRTAKEVWKIRGLSLGEKAVLSQLAFHGNDDGEDAYPDIFRLASLTSQKSVTVSKILNRLIKRGFISQGPRKDGLPGVSYTLKLFLIQGEAEAGDDVIGEQRRRERMASRERVARFRERKRLELVTAPEALRNALLNVTVTPSEALPKADVTPEGIVNRLCEASIGEPSMRTPLVGEGEAPSAVAERDHEAWASASRSERTERQLLAKPLSGRRKI